MLDQYWLSCSFPCCSRAFRNRFCVFIGLPLSRKPRPLDIDSGSALGALELRFKELVPSTFLILTDLRRGRYLGRSITREFPVVHVCPLVASFLFRPCLGCLLASETDSIRRLAESVSIWENGLTERYASLPSVEVPPTRASWERLRSRRRASPTASFYLPPARRASDFLRG